MLETIYEARVIVLLAFICVMTGVMIGVLISLVKMKNKLETIYEAVTTNLYRIDMTRNDLKIATQQIEELKKLHRETKYTVTNIEQLARSFQKLNEKWPKPGEVVELGEIDVNMHMTPAFEKLMEIVESVGKSSEKASESMKKIENAVRGTHSEWDVDDMTLELKITGKEGSEKFESLLKAVEEHRWDDSDSELEGMIEDGLEGGLGRDLDELDIHMISREEYLFGGQHEFSKHRLWYDTVKNILRCSTGLFNSEDFEPESADFLGDGLFYFGVSSESKNVVYIRNHILKADFMVEKASVV